MIVAWRVFVFPYNKRHKTTSCTHIKRIATNAHTVTGVVFLNLPPIVNALGVLRITLCVSLKNLVSIIVYCTFFTPINSTNVYIFIFFQEQGHCNDLISKGGSPVTQDDSHLNSTYEYVVSTFHSWHFWKYQKWWCSLRPLAMRGIRVQMPHCWLFEWDKGCGQ